MWMYEHLGGREKEQLSKHIDQGHLANSEWQNIDLTLALWTPDPCLCLTLPFQAEAILTPLLKGSDVDSSISRLWTLKDADGIQLTPVCPGLITVAWSRAQMLHGWGILRLLRLQLTSHQANEVLCIGEPSGSAQSCQFYSWSFVELSFVVLSTNHVVLPLNGTKFDVFNSERSLQHRVEQSTQQPLIKTLRRTDQQAECLNSRLTQWRTHGIQCNCSFVTKNKPTYVFHPHLPQPRRQSAEPVTYGRDGITALVSSWVKQIKCLVHLRHCVQFKSRLRVCPSLPEYKARSDCHTWYHSAEQPALKRTPLLIFIWEEILGTRNGVFGKHVSSVCHISSGPWGKLLWLGILRLSEHWVPESLYLFY